MKTAFSTLALITAVLVSVSTTNAQQVYDFENAGSNSDDVGFAPSPFVTPNGASDYAPGGFGFNPPPAPAPAPSSVSQPTLGFQGRMLYGQGIVIDSLDYNGQAAAMGVEVGDIITHLGPNASRQFRIKSFAHYLQMLRDAAKHNNGRVAMTLTNNGNPWAAPGTVILKFQLQSGSSDSYYGNGMAWTGP